MSKPVRLVVTAETSAAVDNALIETIALSRRKVSKADLTDAAIRVGLAHLDEVAELLTTPQEDAPDE